MRKSVSLFFIFFLMQGCATAEKSPVADLLKNGEKTGILLQLDGPMVSAVRLSLIALNEDGSSTDNNYLTSSGIVSFETKKNGPVYIYKKVKPRKYVVARMQKQHFWGLCFMKDTVEFDIKPGVVNYIGSFDTTKYINQIDQLAVQSGKLSANRNQFHAFKKNIIRPKFNDVNEIGLLAAQAYIDKVAPNSSRPAVLSIAKPSDIGKTISKNKLCGW